MKTYHKRKRGLHLLERYKGKRTELVLCIIFTICFFLVGFFPEGTLRVFLMMTIPFENPDDFKFDARPFFATLQMGLALLIIQALKIQTSNPFILTFAFFSFALALHLNPVLSNNLIFLFLFAGFILLCRDELKKYRKKLKIQKPKEEE